MPNRNASESNTEYQEMMSGRSPHRGFVDFTPDAPSAAMPPAVPVNKAQPQPSLAKPSLAVSLKTIVNFGNYTRGLASRFFQDTKK